MNCAKIPQDIGLSLAADDVDEADSVGEAQLDQHLAQVGGCGRIDERGMPLTTHVFDKPQCGHRIDETRRPLGRARPVGQDEDIVGIRHLILGVERAAGHGDYLAGQGPGRGR